MLCLINIHHCTFIPASSRTKLTQNMVPTCEGLTVWWGRTAISVAACGKAYICRNAWGCAQQCMQEAGKALWRWGYFLLAKDEQVLVKQEGSSRQEKQQGVVVTQGAVATQGAPFTRCCK